MLHHVRRCLAEHGRTLGAGGASGATIVCLDDSKGRTAGAILLVFPQGAAAPEMIARCAPLSEARLREGRPVYRIDHENLIELEAIGMSEGRRTTPEPLGIWDEDGVLVTLQSALPGRLLKNIRSREAFSASAAPQTVGRVLAWLADFQQRYGVTRRLVDEATYRSEVLAGIERFERRFVLEPNEQRFLARRFVEERRLLGLQLPFTARHGDFCPANVFSNPDGVSVFDWEFPLRRQLPLFDLFHFFAATRFPFSGLRGESSHFDSFKRVYWGDNAMNRLLRQALGRAVDELDIPAEAPGDLFLLALVEIANLKYDGLLEVHRGEAEEPGLGPLADADDEKRRRFRSLGGVEKDVPFARIVDCRCENVRFVSRCGLPPCIDAPRAG